MKELRRWPGRLTACGWLLSGKRAENGELSTSRSIRCTACCQVRGLTQTPALVKGMKCNKMANKVSAALWSKKNEERRRPRRAGRAQETWAGFKNATPIIELRQLNGADLRSAFPLMESSIFFPTCGPAIAHGFCPTWHFAGDPRECWRPHGHAALPAYYARGRWQHGAQARQQRNNCCLRCSEPPQLAIRQD